MSIKGMKMDRMKRAAAAAAAAVIAAGSVTGCSSSTDYSLTANGKKVNAGVYINYMLNEMTNQMYQMYYTGEITQLSDCFDKQVEGQDFITYVKNKALDNTKEFAAVQAKFDELGLSLSEDDAKSIESSVSNAWSTQKDFYEFEGISRESLKMCSEHSYKRSAIFDSMYSADGSNAVSDDDVKNYVNDNYMRYKLVTISKSSETDEEAKKKENEEIKALWEQYVSEAESLDFAGFDKIIEEYDAYKEKKKAEKEAAEAAATPADEIGADEVSNKDQVIDVDVPAAEAANEEKAETEAVTAAETAAPADEDKPADTEDKPAETTAPADSAAPETVEETTTTAAETSAPDASETAPEVISPAPDADAEGSGEEKDPYANESVINFTESVDSSSSYYTENYAKLLTEMNKVEYGKVGKYESDDYYYVFMRADIAERADYPKDHHDTIVHKMKDTEFDGLVKGWIDAASIVVNDKAMKRYTVKEVYDRQEEYASKQTRR